MNKKKAEETKIFLYPSVPIGLYNTNFVYVQWSINNKEYTLFICTSFFIYSLIFSPINFDRGYDNFECFVFNKIFE